MNALNLDQVIALRNAVQEKFDTYVHLHDACGAQTFSVDKDAMTPELQQYLGEYFTDLGYEVKIAETGYFSLR